MLDPPPVTKARRWLGTWRVARRGRFACNPGSCDFASSGRSEPGRRRSSRTPRLADSAASDDDDASEVDHANALTGSALAALCAAAGQRSSRPPRRSIAARASPRPAPRRPAGRSRPTEDPVDARARAAARARPRCERTSAAPLRRHPAALANVRVPRRGVSAGAARASPAVGRRRFSVERRASTSRSAECLLDHEGQQWTDGVPRRRLRGSATPRRGGSPASASVSASSRTSSAVAVRLRRIRSIEASSAAPERRQGGGRRRRGRLRTRWPGNPRISSRRAPAHRRHPRRADRRRPWSCIAAARGASGVQILDRRFLW